jgi:hypothetical protein
MRNKRPLVLLLLACCLAQPALGATVFGTPDCGEWLSGKKGNELDKAWLIGYLSGISVANPKEGDPLGKISSSEQIFVWMNNYCQRNPLKDISDGANRLFSELLTNPK